MNAGKTTVLLQAAHNYSERGMNPFLLTANADTRSGIGVIKSRIGLKKSAQTFSQSVDLLNKVKEVNSKKTFHVYLLMRLNFLQKNKYGNLLRWLMI
tara:strand:- start:104 stop:394 length:291 start_codon:yes stop_codon:yes gene_type:complete